MHEVKCFIIICNAVVKERGGKKSKGARGHGVTGPIWRKTEMEKDGEKGERERGTWGGTA